MPLTGGLPDIPGEMAHSFVPLPLPGLCHSLLFSNRKLWMLVEGHEGLRGALGTCATFTSSLQGVCPPKAHLTRGPGKPWGKPQMPSRARETGGNVGLTLSSLDGTCPTVPRLQLPGRARFSEEALPYDTARSGAPFGEGCLVVPLFLGSFLLSPLHFQLLLAVQLSTLYCCGLNFVISPPQLSNGALTPV